MIDKPTPEMEAIMDDYETFDAATRLINGEPPFDDITYHEPVRRTRIGSAYTTDEGEEIPQHTLTAFDCGCGYRASVFMASEGRAWAIFERHLGDDVRWKCGDCNAVNKWHEAFCRACGAGQPDYWLRDYQGRLIDDSDAR